SRHKSLAYDNVIRRNATIRNKPAAYVQQSGMVMLKKIKNKPARHHRKTDRRILRTRDALGDALVALMREKSFHQITVQQVLDRARIGRSTFYAHYRDTDDLFVGDV